MTPSRDQLYRQASRLAVFTILYNIAEGVVSMWFGAADETLSLFGFGVDSFIEVGSALGIRHMLRRIRERGDEKRDDFERLALRITGGGFYLLSVALFLTAALNLYLRHRPVTTVWGIVISLISILFMWLLIHHKTRIGRELESPALLADAACSRACVYLSLALLASSLGYQLTGVGSLDALGAVVIGLFAFREGREAFQKARGMGGGCCSCP